MVQQADNLPMPRIISVIDRYVLRELTAPLWFSGALLTFFLLLDRIYNLTDLVITKGVPLHLVMQLLVFMMPSFLALTLPMALLVAVLLAGGRLAGDLEIVAFQASGVGRLRLFSPVFATAIAVTLVPGTPPIGLRPPGDEPHGGAAAAGRYRHTLFGIYDMSLPIDAPLKGAARFEKPEKDLSLTQIEEQIQTFADQPFRRAPFEVEWHKRFAFPLASLVLVLVGFPLAIRSHRGGRAIALIGSLTILTSYYLLLTTLEGAALGTRIPAWVAIWTPNALFASTGLAL